MAVWGAPAATEGDAERAVRAGLDLVAAVAQLGTDAGVPGLAARAGVVTGEVAVALGAAGAGVAGDTGNTAARVQTGAEPGQVLGGGATRRVAEEPPNTAPRVQTVEEPGQVVADGATRRLTEAGVGFADAGKHPLKGK